MVLCRRDYFNVEGDLTLALSAHYPLNKKGLKLCVNILLLDFTSPFPTPLPYVYFLIFKRL